MEGLSKYRIKTDLILCIKFYISKKKNIENMKEKRPPIKEAIKREIRQRCGFGCVICGFPIYEYDHMLGWANVKRHVASEITLLCDTHHTAKSSKLMPAFIVEEANRSPYNLRQNFSTPSILYYSGKKAIIKMGRSNFIITDNDDGVIFETIKINEFTMIQVKLEDNHFLLSMTLLDKKNIPVFIIEDNMMKYSVGSWDINFVGRNLTIRKKSRDIFLDINFETPNIINFRRGNFYFRGNKFTVTKEGLKINDKFNNIINIGTIENSRIGICLDGY